MRGSTCLRERAARAAAEGEIARNLSGKRTVDGKDTLESRGNPRAEGVSAADRVPVARVSQASDRGARTAAFSGRIRALWRSHDRPQDLKPFPSKICTRPPARVSAALPAGPCRSPIRAGVMKEHLHTREHAGLFDISHMKLFEVSGPDAAALLDQGLPAATPAALELSQSKYTFFLNEQGRHHRRPDRHPARAAALHGRRQRRQCRGRRSASEKPRQRISTATVTPLDRVFLAIQGPEACGRACRAPASRPAR